MNRNIGRGLIVLGMLMLGVLFANTSLSSERKSSGRQLFLPWLFENKVNLLSKWCFFRSFIGKHALNFQKTK